MSLETLEAKVDTIAETLAGLRGELKGTIHFFPCAASEARVKELEDNHVRPLEDREQQRTGAIRLIALLAVLSTIMVGMLAVVTFFNR